MREADPDAGLLQGPYVLVMVNTGRSHKSNRLQASWLVSAYRGLSRPFRKNVKYIILVRPSKALKAFLTMLRPFLSRKAHRKVVKVGASALIASAWRGKMVPFLSIACSDNFSGALTCCAPITFDQVSHCLHRACLCRWKACQA